MCPPVLPVPNRHRVIVELEVLSHLDARALEKRVKEVIAEANKCGAIKDEKIIVIEKPL